jgi:NADH dehydrogenase
VDLVTGAFGNVGSAIAARLVADGRPVRTLTSHPPDDPTDLDVRPFTWDDPAALAASFEGVETFYDTYWMRLGPYDVAADRCTQLIAAAEAAGVRRIVHLSVVKPSLDSPYPYFRGKAEVEARLAASPVSSAVVRPALIFGGDAALLHDLARLLRRLPVFGLADGGAYRVRPVHVDDVADLCLAAGASLDATVTDAVGPERPTFRELVTEVRDAVGSRARLVSLPASLVLAAGRVLGRIQGQDLLTGDELRSTIEGLADTDGPATGTRSLSEWIRAHADDLGR